MNYSQTDCPSQGMLGTTGGRFLGPSGSQPHRNLWPLHAGRGLDFQTNGDVTESIFAAGYNTPPTHSPFMSISPLELVSKNFHSGTVAFSQANSIFVQSQTDYLGGTVATKKTETCFGRWEHGIEPLQIQVPPLTTIASVSVRPDQKNSSSARSGDTNGINHNTNSNSSANLSNHSRHTNILTNTIRTNDISSGCSRTIPWTSATSSTTNNIVDSRNIGCSLLQIKREPCQVSEITTSNNLGHTALSAVVKIESGSPKRTMDNMQNSVQSAGPIPVGIAVARQRLQLQEHAQQQHQPKEMNRFGIGIATDLGGATSAFSQNMFFTGTNSTMIPFSSEAVTMGVSNVQNAVRTPSTLWQYPTSLPVESMVPMPIPPVGFQLVRDPSTGQFIFLPTATSMDKMYISYPEPFQQAVVWPSYPQQLQTPHLLMPPMAPLSQQMQPPPLTPIQLLGTDYLGGTTLHQHTQTHSTRLVALTSDNKRKSSLSNLPLPATLIKIEDCNTSGNTTTSSHHQQSHMFDPCKSTQIQTIATAVQTSNMTPELESHHQLYYHSEGNLIQIAPHNESCTSMIDTMESRTYSPLSDRREMSPTHDHLDNSNLSGPEVQDANIQTDTPVMSEDDNTTGADDCAYPSHTSPADDSTAIITTSASFNDMCHNMSSISEINSSSSSYAHQDLNNTKTTESSYDSNTTVTSSIIIEEITIPPPETIVLSSYESSESIDTDHQPICYSQKLHAPDISGLELLSNSIEAFEKKAFIKQEPVEKPDYMYSIDTSVTQTEPIDCSMPQKEYISNTVVAEPLGGLNLLCALAEQRIQEEVGQRNRKRSSSSDGSESKRQKKHHKEKHSSKKSGKKSKHNKDRKESRSKHSQSDEEDEEDFVEKNFNETFNRVKASYQEQCIHKKSTGDEEICCREKCNFPTAEEVYSAMHTDMKQKLSAIAKEFQLEKRKLNEIKNLEKTNHSRESTPSSSSKSFSFDGEQSAKSELISPNVCSSSQSETFQADSSKVHSDTESIRFDEADTNSSSCKQRKTDATNVVDSSSLTTIKAKSLVGYIFATKKRINDSKNENSSSMTDETSQSDINSIKQEAADDEELSQEALFGQNKRNYKTAKHQSKHKKSKSKDRKHKRSSEVKNKKKRIDAKCTLTDDHLDNLSLTTKPRVLTAMGGLFYAGCLSAIQPPDIYSVTLDGERGNRPHIMSREEILRDAILEVAPQAVNEVPPGARLCAYWSQQYRCLYPGTAADPSSHDYDFDPKFIVVEFDDGDSGRIAIEDIRFLLSDYPIVDYDPNPLLTLGKRKQPSSHSTSESINEPTTSTNCFSIFKDKLKTDDKEAHKERRRLKKIRKDKKQENSVDKKHKHKHKCNDEFCKHRKHKKRRKHKKHHHRDTESPIEVKNEKDDETIQQEDGVSQTDDSNEVNDEVFQPQIKEETMTEEEATSSVTESSGSTYQPGKKKERQNSAENHSKIAAFLPARQLWAWSGKGIKRCGAKGRGKKQFFRTIQRGKETISVGDSAVFLSTGRPDRPYIGRIESMWETTTNNRIVRVKWYYHPEETKKCPTLVYPGGLFQSPHADQNDVQTISHKCKVLPFDQYTQKYGPDPKEYGSVYDNNDTFYLAGNYDPTLIKLKLEADIPTSSKASDNDKKNGNKDTK